MGRWTCRCSGQSATICLCCSLLLTLFSCSSMGPSPQMAVSGRKTRSSVVAVSFRAYLSGLGRSVESPKDCNVDICSSIVLFMGYMDIPALLWFFPELSWAADEYPLWRLECTLLLPLQPSCLQDFHTSPPLPSILTNSAAFRLFKMCFHIKSAILQWVCCQAVCLVRVQPLVLSHKGHPCSPPATKTLPFTHSRATQNICNTICDLTQPPEESWNFNLVFLKGPNLIRMFCLNKWIVLSPKPPNLLLHNKDIARTYNWVS